MSHSVHSTSSYLDHLFVLQLQQPVVTGLVTHVTASEPIRFWTNSHYFIDSNRWVRFYFNVNVFCCIKKRKLTYANKIVMQEKH